MKQIIFYKGESNPILTPECFSKSKRSWVKAKRVQDSSQIPKPFGINFQTPYRKHNIHRESRGFGFSPIPTRAAPAGYPARLTIRVLCFLFLFVKSEVKNLALFSHKSCQRSLLFDSAEKSSQLPVLHFSENHRVGFHFCIHPFFQFISRKSRL